MKIIAVIPAHMASVRFPGKILFSFHGLPMIEHVRRRALLSKTLSDVVVATCDEVIANVVRSNGGRCLMTSNSHQNGLSRVAEAVMSLNCTHVVLLQGDEPLVLPRHIDAVTSAIKKNPEGDAWNATGILEHTDELDRHSFVKCLVSKNGRIMHCFRRSPATCGASLQLNFFRKILGIIAYRKDSLVEIAKLHASSMEMAESIEQMRIIENDYSLQSVAVTPSLPSVNEPHEALIVNRYLALNSEQSKLHSLINSRRSR